MTLLWLQYDSSRHKRRKVLQPEACCLALGVAELPGLNRLVRFAHAGRDAANRILQRDTWDRRRHEFIYEIECVFRLLGAFRPPLVPVKPAAAKISTGGGALPSSPSLADESGARKELHRPPCNPRRPESARCTRSRSGLRRLTRTIRRHQGRIRIGGEQGSTRRASGEHHPDNEARVNLTAKGRSSMRHVRERERHFERRQSIRTPQGRGVVLLC